MATNAKKNYATAVFTPTAAGDYTSNVVIPTGAIITGAWVIETTDLAGGTSIQLFLGPSASGKQLTAAVVTASIATAPLAFNDGSAQTFYFVDGTTITSGKITLKTVGTYTSGSAKILVEFVK